MTVVEANLDGLIGPTHNYAGLSFGNIASEKNARSVSHPKQAALQGLRKMKFLHDLGVPQLVMPPQLRPDMGALRRLGYKDIQSAAREVLYKVYSASSMWTANAATISPSADTADGKVHITVANLASNAHRAIEAPTTAHYLKQIFNCEHFVHHAALPANTPDEGAANHMRLCRAHGERGTEIFVHGANTKKYPARQSQIAQERIAREHGLDPARTVFLRQSGEAIDGGVFHNDVIAMSNEQLLIYHERAYETVDERLSAFKTHIVRESEIPLADAVSTYFFNSQIVTLPDGKMVVIAPVECEENPKTKAKFLSIVNEGAVNTVHYLDVRESMQNGGGPACLRLRVVLTEDEYNAVHPGAWLTEKNYHALCQWIEKNYRDTIAPDDLHDPSLAEESGRALAELSGILGIDTDTGAA